MSYEVTANRRRPGSFDALTGQEFVVTTIKKSIEANKIAHAYLFSGSRGVGKTSAARILAKSLNCQNGPTPNPCGVCSNCVEIAKGSSLDVIEIDGASNTSVNDVREIKDEVLFAPNTSKYKVYIIDEVHMLSNSAFNALLKTIEEPPPYVVFIFATTEIHKVPATIKSRCQQFNFRLIDVEDIKERLAEACAEMGIKVDQDALFWMAKEGNGSLRDAYTLFDQIVAFSDSHITLEKIREKLGLVGLEQMNQLIETLAGGKSEEALEVLDKIVAQGVSIDQFIIDLAEYFRSLLFIKHRITRESLLGYSAERFPSVVKETFSHHQVEQALELVLELYRKIRYSLNPRYELELLVSRLAELSSFVSLPQLVRKIERMREEYFAGSVVEPQKKNES
jgi:DNA polymerase-3 subunit gamma/tau